ncbi:MAG: urea ABC transporter permease subunit UrtB [Acidobacteria bacterium]|nr:urea ABC transporter permease subunit UrtB [Acidobacteriota bacterium]
MSDLAFYLGQAFNGLSVAGILLLAALGLSLSFGLMRVINLAHGELLMLGGYLAFVAQRAIPGDVGFLAALPLAFVGAGALGAALYQTVIRRLEGRPLDTLLATWGVSLILQQAARSAFGATGVEAVSPRALQGAWTLSGSLQGLTISWLRLFIIGLAALTLAGVWLFFQRTRLGREARAVQQDRDMAQALGIDAERVNRTVFALGAGVAGLAGACLAFLAPVTPTVGMSYVVDAFLVVIVGGVGSVVGAALAALAVGGLSAAAQAVTSASVAKTLLLAATIALLQIRPQGLLPQRTREG